MVPEVVAQNEAASLQGYGNADGLDLPGRQPQRGRNARFYVRHMFRKLEPMGRATLEPDLAGSVLLHSGQFRRVGRALSCLKRNDGEAQHPTDLRHVVTHRTFRYQNGPAVRAPSGERVGVALLTGLTDHLGIEPELGLDADLKTVQLAHEKDIEPAGFGIGYPPLRQGGNERGAELNLARECLVQLGLLGHRTRPSTPINQVRPPSFRAIVTQFSSTFDDRAHHPERRSFYWLPRSDTLRVSFSDGTSDMLPWIHLATATAPQGGTLRLLQRGDEFSIRFEDGNELMNSRLGGSEEALATLALDRLAGRPAPRVLIGGLGMGFTLRAAQAAAPPDARLIVSEIVPELVDWASLHMTEVFGGCLSDPRVEVRMGDVRSAINEGTGEFDAILLDVDNGPDGLTRADNDALYGEAGLDAARRALTAGGVLAVWSAAADHAFSKRLSRCGFDVSARTVRAGRTKRGARHTIWIAVRLGG